MLLCNPFKHGTCLGESLSDNYGDARFDDSCFLSCDLRQRVAEKLGMIEGYICDDGELGGDNVGAVESSTKSHLDDCDIYLLTGKETPA